nr:hypothetical protein [Tanacetum cinerariifolium]
MMLYEALEKSINCDHSKELLKDLAKIRKKKKNRRDSPKMPPGSPPHQPPPPPPPTGPSGTSRSPGASGSSQVPPPPPPPPSDDPGKAKGPGLSQGLVRGLPKIKFEKDHLCSACAIGKSTRKTYKPKSEDTNQEKLYLLHMDICGPRRVESVNGKKYILVIMDDYSRFTWVKFLRSKDETPYFIIKRNRTLIEAARTMLIYAQAPLFLWAEAVATACFTQNRSIIRLRHGKTPYELLHTKLPDLSFFYVFGALCYPTNDSENLGPTLNEMTPGTISSGLVPTTSPSTSYVPPSRNDWDLLFQPMFDELLNPPSSVVNQTPEDIAPISEVIPPGYVDSIGSPSSTMVEQDAPSTSNSPAPTETQSLVFPQDVGDDNLDMEVAYTRNDPLFGVPIPEVTSAQSTTPASAQAILQTNHPMPYHNSKWTKDHPLNNIIGQLSRLVSTRLQLHEQALFCYYDSFLTSVEPKTYKEALTQSCWIEAMQEELNEFERLEVWELVPRPDQVMVITLKWIYKVKLDELGGILKNKARLVAHGYPQEEGIDFKESDIYAAGSESRPPMLNKENYVPWLSRLLRYAKSRPNEKLIHNSILNGPYVKRMIPEPDDANRDVKVTETFHEQTDDELSEKELKQIEADDQAIQT